MPDETDGGTSQPLTTPEEEEALKLCKTALARRGVILDYEISDGLVWVVTEDSDGHWWCAEWKNGKVEIRETDDYPQKKRHAGGPNRNCSVQCCGPYESILWRSATSTEDSR